jgi:outer membrane immunogenic protein
MKISTLAAGVALSALMATGAVAADVYTGDKSLKDDANYANVQVVNWTGFYIGGQVGYGHAVHDLGVVEHWVEDKAGDSEEVARINGFGGAGALGGGRLGFDYAMGRFLVGVFCEYNWSGIKTDFELSNAPFSSGYGDGSYSLEKDNEWSVGARAGVLVAPRTLAYVLAAYTQSDYSLNGLTADDRDSGWKSDITMDGVTIGAGVEYALAGNVFVGLEGLYTMYGKEDVFNNVEEGYGTSAELETDELKVMGTLKIKLGGIGRDK